MNPQKMIHRMYMAGSSAQSWAQGKFTPSGVFVILSVVICAMMGMDTTRTMAFQAFTFLLFLLIASVVASLFSKPNFSARIILPPSTTVGAPFRYSVEITNQGPNAVDGALFKMNLKDPRPSYHEFTTMKSARERNINAWDRYVGPIRWREIIEQRVPVKFKEISLPMIPPKGTVHMNLEAVPINRGYIRLESVTVGALDPFGLIKTLCRIPVNISKPVFPRRFTTKPFSLPGKRKYNQGGVALASAVGDAEEFVGLRDYRPGDPMRKIHWRSWARTGSPVVKEYQEEYYSRHALLLDTFLDVDISGHFEDAVSVASSFIANMETQDALLDLMFIGTETYLFTSGRSLGATSNMLEVLASVIPATGKNFGLLACAAYERLHLIGGVVCVFLSWDQQRQDFVEGLISSGMPTKVFLLVESVPPEGIDPGPMRQTPNMFHILPAGSIEEVMASL
ncbi:MAG: DUF58 domain-containing protein [Nitrospinota bacterium]|nr:DUF58 domain-containing protein [Nitrospinota bacterium]MDH5679054.1 DUF58 domain-containing protein [Nitrospinota bacterium]